MQTHTEPEVLPETAIDQGQSDGEGTINDEWVDESREGPPKRGRQLDLKHWLKD